MNNVEDSNITQTYKKEDTGSIYIGTGLGLGAYAAATTLLVGTACPICIVAAPVLIGAGLYQKMKKGKLTKK
jgi:hypothetical protein